MKTGSDLLGKGIYSVAEAARLTDVRPGRITRWVEGYSYAYRGEQRAKSGILKAHRRDLRTPLALTFLDLLEVRLVNAFRALGVTLDTLRRCAQKAREEFHHSHPFVALRFKTDGRGIFRDAAGDVVYDFLKNQRQFSEVVRPFLKDVKFEGQDPALWYPLEEAPRVVLDPRRCHGKPIIDDGSIPTMILADAFAAEKDARIVSRWFRVEPAAVLDAVRFEEKLRGKLRAA